MTERRNGIVIDDDGPWAAACYLSTDMSFAGTQHGFHGTGTLCGLPDEEVEIVRTPFYGTSVLDCRDCGERLRELAR